ncbi:uncharacterized protein F5891DRAFT_1131008 [Suillus fuscotomentosus]|uniref:DUF6570 domain-containing protein n=1 Tax=Suillus fuscotomentosus TaxID=1912939 RepID=A0AAD4DUR1_9AGAM|nr:uncharacterized protein F5891DRAFT_1131008 [Suillus fuscotomentosus]KAG1894291.1 hypothetical protein F5891DRAFT_1131008 [Suillus fuscotomentosus]
MIALCRAKCFILHLREESCSIPNAQRGLKGNVIIFLQRPSKVLEMLPPSIEDVLTPICVLFVGSSPPTTDWLHKHAKPLIVRKEKVRSALVWLCEHNILYSNVLINHDCLDSMSEEDIVPVHIETVPEDDARAQDVLTSQYDGDHNCDADSSFDEEPILSNKVADSSTASSAEDVFQHVVITDVNGNAPSHELHAAALHHVKEKSGGFIQVPHGLNPMNEYINPELLPKVYPTLFPYGVGGFEHPHRTSPISFKRHKIALTYQFKSQTDFIWYSVTKFCVCVISSGSYGC